jgi:predicted molibdopterin-dependent oxidoreductase YjgC
MGTHPALYPGHQPVNSETTTAYAAAWNAILSETPGMSAVEMVNGITSGKIAALYVMGDDPVGSDSRLGETFRKLEFLVVQDIFFTDTAKLAHVVLPAASVVEKQGTFTNLERRLQQLVQAEPAIAESKPDWEIIQLVAKKMGGSMNYASSSDILREIRSVVPLYKTLAPGAVWPKEASPLAGKDVDLSLTSDSIMKNEVINAERLLFSSGMTITRSAEIGTIRHIKIGV